MSDWHVARRRLLRTVIVSVPAVALVVLALGHGSSAATRNAVPSLLTNGTLVVGMNLQFKPEMYVNSSGQPAGYDVDLLHKLASYAHLKLQIENLSFTGLIPGLQAHKFDLVSTGLADTPARASVVSFTRPYVPYVQVVGIPADKVKSVTTTADLNKPDDEITALLGSTAEQEAEKTFPKAHIVALADQNADFLLVATGRADAIVVEDYLLARYRTVNPGQLAAAKIPALDVQYGSWAVSHGDTKLIAYLDRFLCTEDRNGTLAALYRKNFGVSTFPGVPACAP